MKIPYSALSVPALPHSSPQTPISEAPLPTRASVFPLCSGYSTHLCPLPAVWLLGPILQSPTPHSHANFLVAALHYILPICQMASLSFWSQQGTPGSGSKKFYFPHLHAQGLGPSILLHGVQAGTSKMPTANKPNKNKKQF